MSFEPAPGVLSDFGNGDTSLASRCEDLALEGEKKCKAGDYRTGIQLFEMAVAIGTDDLRLLSVMYCYLGNAYFALGDYAKALEYHRHDLILSRTIGDPIGEGKSSGNLGNTLKALELYDEANICFNKHLSISRKQGLKASEGNALFNMGHLYQMMGRHASRNGASRAEVEELLHKSAEYYRESLKIMEEVGDGAGKGRVFGNLANTYFQLNQYEDAVMYHHKRLHLAKEFGDKQAMKRAYNNLANAHVYLGEVEVAEKFYKKALSISLELKDRASEGRSCFSLGNTCTLLRQHPQAVQYHLRHLSIARELKDGVGEERAAWSLGSAYASLGQHQKALYFSLLHLHWARQIGDENGTAAAEKALLSLKQKLGDTLEPDGSSDPAPVDVEHLLPEVERMTEDSARVRRRPSMENLELCRIDSSKLSKEDNSSSSVVKKPHTEEERIAPRASGEEDTDSVLSLGSRPQLNGIAAVEAYNQDGFFEHVRRLQSKRIDDQRCDPSICENKENRPYIRSHDGFRPMFRVSSLATVNSVNSESSSSGVSARNILHERDTSPSESLQRLLASRAERSRQLKQAITKYPGIAAHLVEAIWREKPQEVEETPSSSSDAKPSQAPFTGDHSQVALTSNHQAVERRASICPGELDSTIQRSRKWFLPKMKLPKALKR